VLAAVPVGTLEAGPSTSAGLEDLNRHPLAWRHAPAPGRRVPHALDDADHLVAGHEAEGPRQRAGVLLVVRAAQAARLHPEHAVVGTDVGDGQVPLAKHARRL